MNCFTPLADHTDHTYLSIYLSVDSRSSSSSPAVVRGCEDLHVVGAYPAQEICATANQENYTGLARQHELDHTDHTDHTYHTDQRYIIYLPRKS